MIAWCCNVQTEDLLLLVVFAAMIMLTARFEAPNWDAMPALIADLNITVSADCVVVVINSLDVSEITLTETGG